MRFERNVVFWVAALAVFVALLWLLSPILLPFVLGMAIAYVLDPLVNQLSKRGVSRLLAAVLILGGFVVALALLVLLIAPVLASQLSAFIDNYRSMRCACRPSSATRAIPGSSASSATI
jgi:predicted PurR-regulated permease PerM